MLAVVDDEQRLALGQHAQDARAQVELRARVAGRIARASRMPSVEAKASAMSSPLRTLASSTNDHRRRVDGAVADLLCEPGLAEPAGAEDGGQPGRRDEVFEGLEVVLAPDQGVGSSAQTDADAARGRRPPLVVGGEQLGVERDELRPGAGAEPVEQRLLELGEREHRVVAAAGGRERAQPLELNGLVQRGDRSAPRGPERGGRIAPSMARARR